MLSEVVLPFDVHSYYNASARLFRHVVDICRAAVRFQARAGSFFLMRRRHHARLRQR